MLKTCLLIQRQLTQFACCLYFEEKVVCWKINQPIMLEVTVRISECKFYLNNIESTFYSSFQSLKQEVFANQFQITHRSNKISTIEPKVFQRSFESTVWILAEYITESQFYERYQEYQLHLIHYVTMWTLFQSIKAV